MFSCALFKLYLAIFTSIARSILIRLETMIFNSFNSYIQTTFKADHFWQVLSHGTVYMNGYLGLELHAYMKGRSKFHLGKDGYYMRSYGMVCNHGSPLALLFSKT